MASSELSKRLKGLGGGPVIAPSSLGNPSSRSETRKGKGGGARVRGAASSSVASEQHDEEDMGMDPHPPEHTRPRPRRGEREEELWGEVRPEMLQQYICGLASSKADLRRRLMGEKDALNAKVCHVPPRPRHTLPCFGGEQSCQSCWERS